MLPGIADRSTKENAILQLVNNLDYNFHHLFLKNPFKNLELIFILNQMGFGVTSKLKEGMPGLEPNSNNLITTFFNNPEFLYCIYHYKEPIHFISNIKTAKTRQVNKKGAQESVSVPKMITGYLKSIQGTKYFDQLAHEYPVAKKDPKW